MKIYVVKLDKILAFTHACEKAIWKKKNNKLLSTKDFKYFILSFFSKNIITPVSTNKRIHLNFMQ